MKKLLIALLLVSCLVSNCWADYGSDFTTGATASSTADSANAPNTIDDNEGTYWRPVSGHPYVLKIDLGVGISKIPEQIRIRSYNDGLGNTWKDFTLAVSTDDSSYTDVYTGQNANLATGWQTFQFVNTNGGRYMRITKTNNWQSDIDGLTYEIELMETLAAASPRKHIISIQ